MKVDYFIPESSFSGYVNSIQGNTISDFFEIHISELYSNKYMPENAFDYLSYYPTVSKGEFWINFTLKNKYIYLTHYELKQRSDGGVNDLFINWTLEGSLGDERPRIIDRKFMKDNDEFVKVNSSRIFKAKRGIYKSFKLSKPQKLLVLQRIDLYGAVCSTIEECKSFINAKNSCIQRRRNGPSSLVFLVMFMSTS